MDDLSGAIQGFLSQPGAMEQLQQMAQQLGLSPQNPPEPPKSGGCDPPKKPEPSGELPISPELLQGLMQAAKGGIQARRDLQSSAGPQALASAGAAEKGGSSGGNAAADAGG